MEKGIESLSTSQKAGRGKAGESVCFEEMPVLSKEFFLRGQENIAHLWLTKRGSKKSTE